MKTQGEIEPVSLLDDRILCCLFPPEQYNPNCYGAFGSCLSAPWADTFQVG